ncbi:MAG: methyl-accepting chemotaxis protein [Gammaproteobacteria bacterium]
MKAPSTKELAARLGGGKLVAVLGVLLLISLGLMAGAFYYTNQQGGYEKEYISIAAEQGLLSQRLATFSIEAANGKSEAFKQLKQLRDQFDKTLLQLQKGESAKGLPPLPTELKGNLGDIETSWKAYRQNIDTILNGQEPISKVTDYVQVINNYIPQLLANSDEVVTELVKRKADQQEIYVASRQLMLTQRIENNLNKVLAGGEGAATAADRFGRDAALFGRVLEGMIRGYPALNIQKVSYPEARDRLREVAMLFSTVSEHVGAILQSSPQLFEIKDAASQVEGDSRQVLTAAGSLEKNILSYGQRLQLIAYAGYGFGGIALVLLVLMGYQLYMDARRRLAVTTEQNRRNQRAILRLLDEMTNLAEGDLTVHATVTEDITGAIADSVNYAIDALRSLVTTINQTAGQVASAVENTQATAMRLTDASNHQAREIASASAAVTDMADSIEQVSNNASTSAEVADKSVQIAHAGAETVRRTIDGMNTIREQIQETAKRIKRLGESSQEIGDIVSLINDIADQTNILALNAAIQASSAGEAGRGFAVVADEVQRLAERSANATKQIEALVKTIQADTNEAVISMEQSTANVVKGARFAQESGEALEQIENVSNQLSQLIKTISAAAQQQAAVAGNISHTMNVIQEITMQTSEGTTETSGLIGNLSSLAGDLRKSVSGFKLPQEQTTKTMIVTGGAAALEEEEKDATLQLG